MCFGGELIVVVRPNLCGCESESYGGTMVVYLVVLVVQEWPENGG